MARQPQVTRTIQTTKASILCVNTTNGTTFVENVTLPRVFKDDKHILKAAEKVLNPETSKPVHVIAAEVQETLYGMSEQQFISMATVLPPRKPTNEAETATAIPPEE